MRHRIDRSICLFKHVLTFCCGAEHEKQETHFWNGSVLDVAVVHCSTPLRCRDRAEHPCKLPNHVLAERLFLRVSPCNHEISASGCCLSGGCLKMPCDTATPSAWVCPTSEAQTKPGALRLVSLWYSEYDHTNLNSLLADYRFKFMTI